MVNHVDTFKTKPGNKEYREGWDSIFGKKEDCKHSYSRSMNQEYPRKCTKCAEVEEIEEITETP